MYSRASTFSTHPWDYRSGWYSFSEPKTIGAFYLAEGRRYVACDGNDLRCLRIPPVTNPPNVGAGSGDDGNVPVRGSCLVQPIDLDSIFVPSHKRGEDECCDEGKKRADSFAVLDWVAENLTTLKAAGKDFDKRLVWTIYKSQH
jgi:hypothetical protein